MRAQKISILYFHEHGSARYKKPADETRVEHLVIHVMQVKQGQISYVSYFLFLL